MRPRRARPQGREAARPLASSFIRLIFHSLSSLSCSLCRPQKIVFETKMVSQIDLIIKSGLLHKRFVRALAFNGRIQLLQPSLTKTVIDIVSARVSPATFGRQVESSERHYLFSLFIFVVRESPRCKIHVLLNI